MWIEELKSRVSMLDVAQKYGFETNRQGFICCPFHREKTPSMKLYPGDRGYFCFGCGAHGDVIDFVEKVCGVGFVDACKILSADFGISDSPRSIMRERKIAQDRLRKKNAVEAARLKYLDSVSAWLAAEYAFAHLAPANESAEACEEFTMAAFKRATLQYRMEEAESEWKAAESLA